MHRDLTGTDRDSVAQFVKWRSKELCVWSACLWGVNVQCHCCVSVFIGYGQMDECMWRWGWRLKVMSTLAGSCLFCRSKLVWGNEQNTLQTHWDRYGTTYFMALTTRQTCWSVTSVSGRRKKKAWTVLTCTFFVYVYMCMVQWVLDLPWIKL